MQTPVTVPLQAGMRTNSTFLDLNDPSLPGADATGQTPTQVRVQYAAMVYYLSFVNPLTLFACTCMLTRQMHASVWRSAKADGHTD